MHKQNLLKETAFADEARTRLRAVVRYDSNTGKFYLRETGSELGYKHPKNGIVIPVLGKQYLAHRLAWLFTWGYYPTQVRHMDGDKTNNKLSNLY